MTCEHCEHTVEAALADVGAVEAKADFRRGVARFGFDGDPTPAVDAVRAAGYRPGVPSCPATPELRGPLRRTGGEKARVAMVEKAGYLTSPTAMQLHRVRESLVVVGGNIPAVGRTYETARSAGYDFEYRALELEQVPRARVDTVSDLADSCAPYLTMAESITVAARTFAAGVSKLSCCAA